MYYFYVLLIWIINIFSLGLVLVKGIIMSISLQGNGLPTMKKRIHLTNVKHKCLLCVCGLLQSVNPTSTAIQQRKFQYIPWLWQGPWGLWAERIWTDGHTHTHIRLGWLQLKVRDFHTFVKEKCNNNCNPLEICTTNINAAHLWSIGKSAQKWGRRKKAIFWTHLS